MAYKMKVLLIAIAEIISKSDSIEDIYRAVADMANAEGVILKPLEEMKRKTGSNSTAKIQ